MSLVHPMQGSSTRDPQAAGLPAMDSVLNTAPCGFLTFTDHGTILRANETLGGWLGYDPQDLQGRPFETVLSIGGRVLYQTYIFPLLMMHGHADEIHFSLKPKSGQPIPVLTNVVRRRAEDAFVNDCVFLPMHQRGEYERELLHARKTADEASQAKAKFLSRMSHELRTPMNAILGFGQLLEADGLPPQQAQQVAHILKAGRHLLELINEVLDISRVEAGQLNVALEAVPVGDLMRTVLDLARPLANRAGIDIQIAATPHNACSAFADRVRLRQILLNLVANAIKYNRPGGKVTISCEHVAKEATAAREGISEANVRLVVGDTGQGISLRNLGKLFAPFERLGAETNGIEGTGLGLALCKSLAEAMDGHIGVHSVEGEGSRFWVDLPLGPDQIELDTTAEHKAQTSVTNNDATGQALLLYIEDNPSNLALIEEIIKFRPSYRLVSAATGTAGVEMALDQSPDLILLDLHLPDIRGDVVIERLQGDERTRDIPVVMLSADATPRQMERLLKLGARDYLTKPVGVQQLLHAVDALISKEMSKAPNDRANASEMRVD